MTPRWHHSRLFRFGLVGLLMLLIAWGLYPRTLFNLIWSTPETAYAFSKTPASIRLGYVHYGLPASSGYKPPTGFIKEFFPIPDYQEVVRFGPALRIGSKDIPSVGISFWFMVVLYTTAWVCTMVWWHRRKTRLTT